MDTRFLICFRIISQVRLFFYWPAGEPLVDACKTLRLTKPTYSMIT